MSIACVTACMFQRLHTCIQLQAAAAACDVTGKHSLLEQQRIAASMENHHKHIFKLAPAACLCTHLREFEAGQCSTLCISPSLRSVELPLAEGGSRKRASREVPDSADRKDLSATTVTNGELAQPPASMMPLTAVASYSTGHEAVLAAIAHLEV